MGISKSEHAHLEALTRAQHTTLAALTQIDERTLLELTELTLPKIHELQNEIAQVLPVGNLPAMILTGLTQLKGRKIGIERIRQDVNALLRGLDLLPQGLFGVLVGGPATVLYVYQKILRLAGKDLSSAFPHGTWQFYLEFGMREDTSRHTNETIGFQAVLSSHSDPAIELTAWICTAIEFIYQYNDLLSVDWRERVMLRIVQEETREAGLAELPLLVKLSRDWNRARPYRCPPNRNDYLRYRLETFETFIQDRLQRLPTSVQARISERYVQEQAALSAYVEQMTLLAALTPDIYQEVKEPIPFWRARVGFIWKGCTYLIPICQRNAQGSPLCFSPNEGEPPILLYSHPEGLCDAEGNVLDVDGGGRVWYRESKQPLGNLRAPTPATIRTQVQAVSSEARSGPSSDFDLSLVICPRASQAQVRKRLSETLQNELAHLRRAPILINWDLQTSTRPLAHIRQTHRGIGDHALTVFRTDASIVFDQSHIFFDGTLGMAVAEIMTNRAVTWYKQLVGQTYVSVETSPVRRLRFLCEASDMATLPETSVWGEGAAESDTLHLAGITRLRKWLKQRGVALTVNDLLLLYRAFHAVSYVPSQAIEQALEGLKRRVKNSDYKKLKDLFAQTLARYRDVNPALLIPMDASNVSPHERLFPTTFRNPLPDLPVAFSEVRAAYKDYHQRRTAAQWHRFDKKRRELLAYLKAFGEFTDTLRAITMRGESLNSATLRLLGHLPPAMQHLLDQIPQRIGVLNEVLKGNEVFSNVGRVVPGSSLRRFTSAKDDGSTKELVWGVLTDDQGQIHISLRDFRPFIPQLFELGESQLADMLAQDYLDNYVTGLKRFVAELSTIIAAKSPAS